MIPAGMEVVSPMVLRDHQTLGLKPAARLCEPNPSRRAQQGHSSLRWGLLMAVQQQQVDKFSNLDSDPMNKKCRLRLLFDLSLLTVDLKTILLFVTGSTLSSPQPILTS